MIRHLCEADIPQLLLIEEATQVIPWTRETFHMCLQTHYPAWVIEADEHIIGFMIASFLHDECHLLNISISRPYQRHGYGKQLIQHLIHHAKSHGSQMIFLEVRRSNASAIAFYQQLQFQQIGERRDYYPTVGGKEDALVLAVALRHL